MRRLLTAPLLVVLTILGVLSMAGTASAEHWVSIPENEVPTPIVVTQQVSVPVSNAHLSVVHGRKSWARVTVTVSLPDGCTNNPRVRATRVNSTTVKIVATATKNVGATCMMAIRKQQVVLSVPVSTSKVRDAAGKNILTSTRMSRA